MVGEIAELHGDKADATGRKLAVGDRVTWAVADSCGACFFCARDLPQKCERLKKYGHHAHDPNRGPSGGLTTHCHLWPGTSVVRVPDAVPDEVAAPAMCATATVAGALRLSESTGRNACATILILGAGMLGLTAAAMSVAAGAVPVVADTNPDRLTTAKRFGAAHTALVSGLPALLKELTDGRGADVVLELAGVSPSVETALASARVGGTVVLVGSVFPVPAVAVSPEAVVRRCLRIVGSHNYTPEDLVAAMDFLAGPGEKYPFAELVPQTLPLDEVNEAFRVAEAEKPFRLAVRP
jgi:alcohol dehydrogenase